MSAPATTIQYSTHPESLYSKVMLQQVFGVGKNRADKLQQFIIRNHLEHVRNGFGIIAPLSTWYEAMKHQK